MSNEYQQALVRLERFLKILRQGGDGAPIKTDIASVKMALVQHYKSKNIDTRGKICNSCNQFRTLQHFFLESKCDFYDITTENDYNGVCYPCRMKKTQEHKTCFICKGAFTTNYMGFGRLLPFWQKVMHPEIPWDDGVAVTGPKGFRGPKVHARCCPRNSAVLAELPVLRKLQSNIIEIRHAWGIATPRARELAIGEEECKLIARRLIKEKKATRGPIKEDTTGFLFEIPPQPRTGVLLQEDEIWERLESLTYYIHARPLLIIVEYILQEEGRVWQDGLPVSRKRKPEDQVSPKKTKRSRTNMN